MVILSNPKNQHYLPQFYLRYFSQDGKSIHTYDKVNDRSFHTSTENVAHERYFYKLPTVEEVKENLDKHGKDEKFIVEEVLAFYDDVFSGVVGNLVSNIRAAELLSVGGYPKLILSREAKFDISQFAVIQDLRTKETREGLAQMNHLMMESIYEMVGKMKFPDFEMSKFKLEMREGEDALRQVQLLLDEKHISGIARVLTEMQIWMLGVNNTGNPLILSDHPIIKKSHDPTPWRGGG